MRCAALVALLVGVLALHVPGGEFIYADRSRSAARLQAGKNSVCCFQGNATEQEACKNAPYDTDYWGRCVGATGYGCNGVQKWVDVLGVQLFPLDFVKVVPYADDMPLAQPESVWPRPKSASDKNQWVAVWTSVGAILHDRCCMQHTHGVFCNQYNYPVLATINAKLAGKGYNNDCACMLEWRRAVWDLGTGKGAVMAWKNVSDQTLNAPARSTRQTALPGDFTLALNTKALWTATQWTPISNQGTTETVGTSNIQFPAGSNQICIPAIDPKCEVEPKGILDKIKCALVKCYACASVDAYKGCDATAVARWRPEMSKAGDAQWCKSQTFKAVVRISDTDSYGVCA